MLVFLLNTNLKITGFVTYLLNGRRFLFRISILLFLNRAKLLTLPRYCILNSLFVVTDQMACFGVHSATKIYSQK